MKLTDAEKLKQIGYEKLVAAAEGVGLETDGVKKVDLLNSFMDAVDAIPSEEEEKLGAEVIAMYNHVVAVFEVGGEIPPPEEEKPKPPLKKAGKVPVEKKAVAPKAPKAPKEPKGPRYTRLMAFGDAIKKKGGTIEDLADRADELYAAKGGKSNPKESRDDVNRGIQILTHLGVVKKSEKGVCCLVG